MRSFYENTAHDHSLRTFEILDFCEKDKMKTVSQAQDAFLFDILDSLYFSLVFLLYPLLVTVKFILSPSYMTSFSCYEPVCTVLVGDWSTEPILAPHWSRMRVGPAAISG